MNYNPPARNKRKHVIQKIIGHHIKESTNKLDIGRNDRRTWFICLLRTGERKFLLKDQIIGFKWFFLGYAWRVKDYGNADEYADLMEDKELLDIVAQKVK